MQQQPALQQDTEGKDIDDLFFYLSVMITHCLQQTLKMSWLKLIATCQMLIWH